MPQNAFELVQAKLLQDEAVPKYKKVVMSLHNILSGDFLTKHVKEGRSYDFKEYLRLPTDVET